MGKFEKITFLIFSSFFFFLFNTDSSCFVRVPFWHEGVQRVQNASIEYKRHVRVNDIGFHATRCDTATMITQKIDKDVQKCPRGV